VAQQGKILFLSVCEIVKELYLPRTKLRRVTTDGVRSVIGKETGFVGGTGKEIDKQDPEICVALTLWKSLNMC
jgi:hypothetical protein